MDDDPAPRQARARRPGSATHLPFRDAAFAAALAVLTVHHWPDPARGLAELTRVAAASSSSPGTGTSGFWLVDEYFPEIVTSIARSLSFAPGIYRILGSRSPDTAIPHDCVDGLGAYWRRPEAYLDDGVRGAISTFAKIKDVGAGVARLRRDLEDGSWAHATQTSTRTELDLGYRLVVARRDEALEERHVRRTEGSGTEAGLVAVAQRRPLRRHADLRLRRRNAVARDEAGRSAQGHVPGTLWRPGRRARLLRLLADEDVPATFYPGLGGRAPHPEARPSAMLATRSGITAIATTGRIAKPDAERAAFEQGMQALEDLLDVRPRGYRAPAWSSRRSRSTSFASTACSTPRT